MALRGVACWQQERAPLVAVGRNLDGRTFWRQRASSVFFGGCKGGFLAIFFAMAVCGVLLGFLGKMGGRTSCFDGEFVVKCVVKLVS
jgi:hypothetical protein